MSAFQMTEDVCAILRRYERDRDGYEADYAAEILAVHRKQLAQEIAAETLFEVADLLAPESGISMGMQPTRAEIAHWLRERARVINESD